MSSKIVPGYGRGIEQYTWRAFLPEVHGKPGEENGPSIDAQLSALAAEAERKMTEAFERGRREGRLEGERAAMAQLDPVISKLARTIADVASSGSALRRDAEEDVVKLAVAVARRILHRELSLDPEAVLGLVKVALDRVDAQEVHRVRTHPDDAPRIAAEIGSMSLVEKIQVLADSTLERGAVLFETKRGILDASLSTQLAEIERGLTDRIQRRP
jgi:flagellar assembly protein FliH